jgi:hypothetical protein
MRFFLLLLLLPLHLARATDPPAPPACPYQFASLANEHINEKLASGSYRVQDGGFIELENGSVVEGSVSKGGMQPNYVVDYADSNLKRLISDARSIKDRPLLEKIKLITSAAQRTLHKNGYEDPDYLKLMKHFRERGEAIPVGQYIEGGCGTCRENAIFMHLALKEAGVPNKLTYSKYTHFNYDARTGNISTVTEDHAFSVVELEGKPYIIDSYFHEAHGLSLQAITDDKFITRDTPRAPWAYDLWDKLPASVERLPVHVEKIHDFPKYWIPR